MFGWFHNKFIILNWKYKLLYSFLAYQEYKLVKSENQKFNFLVFIKGNFATLLMLSLTIKMDVIMRPGTYQNMVNPL